MNISDKIRLTREERQLSREQVAGKLGISLTAYGNIERGETDISLSRLEGIANVLGRTVVELMLKGEEGIVIIRNPSTSGNGDNSSITINIYGKEYESLFRHNKPTEED